MTVAGELAELFRRDLKRLRDEVEAFQDTDRLWAVLPGITNSAGNLALHLEGNLREFVGRQLGGIAYARQRPLEFSTRDLPVGELALRMAPLAETIPQVIEGLSAEALEALYPENVLGQPLSTRHFLIHLHGHLTYHLGQINYLRRVLTGA
jgi:uncharacterized damage-inducible protein DinB